MGFFRRVEEGDKLQVNFENIGTVTIEWETWIQRNRLGERIGSICQFPVVLT